MPTEDQKEPKKPKEEEFKPKFKVDDFIVNDYCMGRIVEITNDAYLLDTEQGIPFSCNSTHLWDIAKDAKNGDILVSNQIIILFKKFEENSDWNFVIAYAGIDISGKLQITNKHWLISNKAKPATKEQCDLLFQKMKEAGYEWDSNRKELKKTEQKPTDKEMKTPEESLGIDSDTYNKIVDECIYGEQKSAAWSEEDEKMQDRCINAIQYELLDNGQDEKIQTDESIRWLKSLKDRVQPNQEWDEEYDKKAERIIRLLQDGYDENCIKSSIDWLKSIRPQNSSVTDDELGQAKKDAYNDALDKLEYHSGEPTFDDGWNAAIWYLKKRKATSKLQWKPSEEQMKALDIAIRCGIQLGTWEEEALESLIEQLEQLMKLSDGAL